jgi:hypothetical protein
MHPFNYAINITFFGGTNFNKKCDEMQQKFLKHLALEVNYLLMILCSISFSFLSCGRSESYHSKKGQWICMFCQILHL